MSFKSRNLYYLQIAEHSVLPVYLYLDERHLDWMSDQVLQHVLSDLRPRILPKLLAETGIFTSPATAKKAAVDTHRGDTYQFCYFLRRTEPHSVAIKTRNYIARTQILSRTTNLPGAATVTTASPRKTQKKRKTRSGPVSLNSSLSRSTKKRKKDTVLGLDDSENSEGGEPTSARPQVVEVIDIDQDEDMIDVGVEEDANEEDEAWIPERDDFDLNADEEEEKPKPALQLKYKGFGIYGQCLCIVVEPWPAIRSTTRPLQELGGITSLKSKEMQVTTPSRSTITARAQTPLFLVDEDDTQPQQSIPVTDPWDILETVEYSDDDSEIGGMMAFSQALNLAGDTRPGAVEDDDEMSGAVLFGDADEARQL